MSEGLAKRLQNELEKYKSIDKDYRKCVSTREQLEGQLTENNSVKEELEHLESESTVFKMMGPVLVKQDQEEAKHTVQKRIDYITENIKKHDELIKDLSKKQDAHQETMQKLQHQLQQSQVKAAARA